MTADAVVFAKGDYTCTTRYGIATVTVPRDIRLGEVLQPFAEMFEGIAHAAKTENAPHQPTKAREAHQKHAAKAAKPL